MIHFIRTTIGLLALTFTLMSCQRDESVNVNQDSIYAEYRLVYDADDDKTYARASFRFGGVGGTLLELSDGASVEVDGDPLTYRLLFAYYERESAGVASDGSFVYTDLDGNTFANEVTMGASIAVPASLDTIPQDSAFTLTWAGDPISAGESVIVTINGQVEADARVFTTEDIGATSIILDKDKLGEVGTGPARIRMERFQGQLIQEGTSEGGAVWSRYLSETKDITVVAE